MPTVSFQVRSERVKDIELQENATVTQLKDILAGAGYDVVESTKIRIHRPNGITVFGQVGSYKLKDAENVEICTRVVGPFKALEQRVDREVREAVRNAKIEQAKAEKADKACNEPKKKVCDFCGHPTCPGKPCVFRTFLIRTEGIRQWEIAADESEALACIKELQDKGRDICEICAKLTSL